MASKQYHLGAASFDAPQFAPGLYLVATPIGNLGDITIRALQVLAACDCIYCEDTRVSARLLDRYGIRTAMKTYHEHNAARVRPDIIAALREGKVIVLVSDAGTPMISDPGYKLVEACVMEGVTVTSVPGASAVLTGLQLAALPSDRFSFFGFLPEKQSHRLKLLEQFSQHPMTMVFYESPHRLADALDDIVKIMPERAVAVARELTKLHEEVLRGRATDILGQLAQRQTIKGEIVLVISPAPDDHPADEAAIENAITDALSSLPASKAAVHVAKLLHLTKEDVYARILKRKSDGQA